MDKKSTFIILDEDDSAISSIEKIINRLYPSALVYKSEKGANGWRLIKNHGANAIILIDIFLPEISGMKMLKNIRAEENLKNAIVIILTTGTDKENNILAMQQGADDFIEKPFSIDILISRIRAAKKILDLKLGELKYEEKIEELNDILEKDVSKFKDLLTKFQEIRLKNTERMRQRIKKSARWIANRLEEIEDEEYKMQIEYASDMCYIGKLFLPDRSIEAPVMERGIVKSSIMNKVPSFAKELLEDITGLETASELLFSIYENFDGSGIPKQKMSKQIPIGSRIIRVALDFEDLLSRHHNNYTTALEALYNEIFRLYDFRIVALFEQYLAETGAKRRGKENAQTKISELKSGMILANNIYTKSGAKILSDGVSLTDAKIEKIKSMAESDPIIGTIYIQK